MPARDTVILGFLTTLDAPARAERSARPRRQRVSEGAAAVAAELRDVPSFLDRVPPEELERARRELAELPEVAGRPYRMRKRKAPR